MEQIKHITARVFGLIADEDGAVTVDWVVLTGALVLLGLASVFIAAGDLPGFAGKVGTFLSEMTVVE